MPPIQLMVVAVVAAATAIAPGCRFAPPRTDSPPAPQPPAPVTTLAPAYIEHDLPTIWLRHIPGRESRGEVEAAFMLRPAPGRPYAEIPAEQWARRAAEVGAVFFAVFSQDAKQPGWTGGMDGWPLKGTAEYERGQLANLGAAAAALRATGVDLSHVRCLYDIESKHASMVPLAVRISKALGFTIGPEDDRWAANFGSGPEIALRGAWITAPAPDGRTAGIITYDMAGTGDRDARQIRAEIDAVKSAADGKGRYVVWYRTNSTWAASMLSGWRADPACKAVVGWTPN